MQGLKAAMVVFCTACICAELVAQITENGWARRGIKVVAGLYILAAALRVLPQLKAEGNVFSVPTVSSVELGTWEQAALAQTQTQLEQDLEERFRREAGVSAGVTLALRSASDSVTVDSVTVTPAADCTPEQQQAVEKIVEEALGVRPEWNAPGGETQP